MAEMNGETTHCSNCKKDIATGNFVMHEMHCHRHIVLCDYCKEPVPRSEMEQHFNDLHAKVSCTVCGDRVEKNKLEDHVDNTCSKKPSLCSFCELEVPQSELASHTDYCGTRTESCHLCGQFIMLKDQLQHETSGCQYPVPKPQENGDSGLRNEHDFMGDFQYPGTFHPFAYEEIGRILESRIAPPTFRRADYSMNADQPRIQFEGSRMSRPVGQMRNDTSVRKSTTNRKSELNKKRERVSERHFDDDDDDNDDSEDVDVVTDHMLALQLAQGLDSGDELNQLIQNFEKHNPVPLPELPHSDIHISPDLNRYPEDDELMPCEFCDELFSADILIEHQSGCDPLLSGAWVDAIPMSEGCNNESTTTSRHTVTHIPVINNLGRETQPVEREIPIIQEWVSPVKHVVDDDDDVMLPCEFCEELFPHEFLVQHQSVCDANTTMSPRATTPAVSKTPKPRNVHSNYTDNDTSARSQKHQAVPDFTQYMDLTEEPQREFYTPAFNDTRPEVLTPTSSKYGVPADRFNDHLIRPPRLDHQHHDPVVRSRPNNLDRPPPQRGSAARTRSTLDSLLQGNVSPGSVDYLASVNSSGTKALKNEDNFEKRRNVAKGPRKVVANTNSSPQVLPARHRPPDQRSNQVPANQRGSRSRPRQSNGSLVEEPPFQFESGRRGRRRTGNQIFSPSARGNTQHKSPFSSGDQN